MPPRGAGYEVVASGLGDDTGGGTYVLRQGAFETIDRVSTTGLAVTPDGSCLARLLWTDDEPDTPGEVLIYDEHGVLAYHRVDELHEPHDAIWDGELLVVVSTRANTILWLNGSGAVERRWQASGEGDSWHLNSLALHRGRLLVSAFGRFDEHRGWLVDASVCRDSGIVIDVASSRDVLDGLTSPHNPTWLDGRWLLCRSVTGELLSLTTEGREIDRRMLGGWTRGLAYDQNRIYVGVSAHRLYAAAEGQTASIVALDRASLEVVDRWPLPCRDVYSVTLVPTPLVRGLHAGFRTNRLRVAEQDALGLVGTVGCSKHAAERPPFALEHFPADLKPGLSYSGIYGDGWVDRQASVVLAAGAAAEFVLLAEVPPAPGGQWLQLLVDGRQLAERAVSPGQLELRVPLPATKWPRLVELRWASAPALPEPDGRSVSALVKFLGMPGVQV